MRRTLLSKQSIDKKSYRPPEADDDEEETEEEDEEGFDILDKNIESFKLVGIFATLLSIAFTFGGLLSGFNPRSAYLPDDPLLLTFRLLLIISISVSVCFIAKWRRLVTS